MAIPGVQGIGVGKDGIYVVALEEHGNIPALLDGIPVTVGITGVFRGLGG